MTLDELKTAAKIALVTRSKAAQDAQTLRAVGKSAAAIAVLSAMPPATVSHGRVSVRAVNRMPAKGGQSLGVGFKFKVDGRIVGEAVAAAVLAVVTDD